MIPWTSRCQTRLRKLLFYDVKREETKPFYAEYNKECSIEHGMERFSSDRKINLKAIPNTRIIIIIYYHHSLKSHHVVMEVTWNFFFVEQQHPSLATLRCCFASSMTKAYLHLCLNYHLPKQMAHRKVLIGLSLFGYC